MKAYKVRNWEKHFEKAESRRANRTRWVPVPNTHDGKRYARVTKLPNATDVFCAWNLILQVASKMPQRGLLVDDEGEALNAEDLADITRFPPGIFEAAFGALVDSSIGWLEIVEIDDPYQTRSTPVASEREISPVPHPYRTRSGPVPEEGNGTENSDCRNDVASNDLCVSPVADPYQTRSTPSPQDRTGQDITIQDSTRERALSRYGGKPEEPSGGREPPPPIEAEPDTRDPAVIGEPVPLSELVSHGQVSGIPRDKVELFHTAMEAVGWVDARGRRIHKPKKALEAWWRRFEQNDHERESNRSSRPYSRNKNQPRALKYE